MINDGLQDYSMTMEEEDNLTTSKEDKEDKEETIT